MSDKNKIFPFLKTVSDSFDNLQRILKMCEEAKKKVSAMTSTKTKENAGGEGEK